MQKTNEFLDAIITSCQKCKQFPAYLMRENIRSDSERCVHFGKIPSIYVNNRWCTIKAYKRDEESRRRMPMVPTTEKVWDEYNTVLKHFILKRVPDEPGAEDILQDVFLKIHTHIDTLRESDKLQSWIYQIARNAITDYFRTYKPTPDIPEISYMPEDPFDDVVSDLLPFVRELVDNLPPDYRQALILTEYEGLTQRELAEKLGISVSGAKSRVQRAREKVKLMLLRCCHFEFDRLGRIINYEPNCDCCVNQDCSAGCK